MLRVLIIDDERLARQNLRQLIVSHGNLNIVGEASSATEALVLIEREHPDAIFLDVQMPGADGFSLLKNLEHPPRVVFVTAHTAHAAKAFDVEAVDYLLKPVRPSRFALAIQRLESRSPSEIAWEHMDKICLKSPGRTVIVPPERIVALVADGDFTRIFINGEKPLLMCHHLSFYEKTLPSPPFVRLDRSLMINATCVRTILTEPSLPHQHRLNLNGIEQDFLLGRTAHQRLLKFHA